MASVAALQHEYLNENIYVTFQDDYSVGHVINAMNHERILWASDFPHSDSAIRVLGKIDSLSAMMTAEQARCIFSDNVAELYGLGVHKKS